ncbi:DNA polymerase delta, subunit 4 domain-containing protein [Hirsutella rhossiliensis]|uniref:DNA polymerase delta, subunit 4 domain-containing protein n=1 Tax=Hirsutella rhossiliensis TaxID=111463 RepID=A0A9P8MTE1_9HYPO|nr:DNA polymerase delta, subunit 4 domain-containing protein [Hirsutella rhossiliensis]KAH0960834.1 DNA polymerase delta, subunit 4 domain-containing protein [Hirsutella rhossiliensis]
MPPTRRTTGGARAHPGPVRGQSTISFSGKVTKSVPTDAKKAVVSPSVAKIAEPETAASPAEDIEVEESDVADEAGPELHEEIIPDKTEAEAQAEEISDAQINKYWKAVESQRKAPRVHQEDLDVSEMVLRYFDVSSQYGPCIGLDRMKRWQRAERLGLNPPIEVLAVLLKEDKKGTRDIETAQMDKILSSIAVSA